MTSRSPEQYAKMHKEAFRAAFDFLNSHFPPGEDADWWEKTAKDGQAASIAQDENKLAVGLLVGVYTYLEHEWRLRRSDNGSTDN